MDGEGEVVAQGSANNDLQVSIFQRSKTGELFRRIPVFCPKEEDDTCSQTIDRIIP